MDLFQPVGMLVCSAVRLLTIRHRPKLASTTTLFRKHVGEIREGLPGSFYTVCGKQTFYTVCAAVNTAKNECNLVSAHLVTGENVSTNDCLLWKSKEGHSLVTRTA